MYRRATPLHSTVSTPRACTRPTSSSEKSRHLAPPTAGRDPGSSPPTGSLQPPPDAGDPPLAATSELMSSNFSVRSATRCVVPGCSGPASLAVTVHELAPWALRTADSLGSRLGPGQMPCLVPGPVG